MRSIPTRKINKRKAGKTPGLLSHYEDEGTGGFSEIVQGVSLVGIFKKFHVLSNDISNSRISGRGVV